MRSLWAAFSSPCVSLFPLSSQDVPVSHRPLVFRNLRTRHVSASRPFPTAMLSSSVSFRVSGMRCGSCIRRCESIVLRAITSASCQKATASADLLTGKLTVTYFSDSLSKASVVRKIQSALLVGGFPSELVEGVLQNTPRITPRITPPISPTLSHSVRRLPQASLRPMVLGFALYVLSTLAQQICCGPFSFLPNASLYFQLVSLIAVVLYLTFPLRYMVLAGLSDIRHRSISMNALVCFSVAAQCAVSLFALFTRSFASKFHEIVVLLLVVQLGRVLEGGLRSHTIKSTKDALADLQPKLCTRVIPGHSHGVMYEDCVDVHEVIVGDVLVVKSGDRFPADGVLTTRPSPEPSVSPHERILVDLSVITGEPTSSVEPGDRVWAGGLNKHCSAVFVVVTAVTAESEMAVTMKLVDDALGTKSALQRLVDSAASVLGVVALSIASLVLFLGFMGCTSWLPPSLHGVAHAPFLVAASVLAAACPCSLALAVPSIALVAISSGARQGILFRDARALELVGASSISIVALDKTGTITTGNMIVRSVHTSSRFRKTCSRGNSREALVHLAALVERFAVAHPVAQAIISYSRQINPSGAHAIAPLHPSQVTSIPGCGVTAEGVALGDFGFDTASTVYVGSQEWLASLNILGSDASAELHLPESSALSTVAVYCRELGGLLGFLEVEDEVTVSLEEVVEMRNLPGKPQLAVLSGDKQKTTEFVAAAVGICEKRGDVVVGGLKPSEKKTIFEALSCKLRPGASVAIGDGVNDGPLLASADVGIAVGRLGDGVAPVAASAASIVIPNGGLKAAKEAFIIGRVARLGMLASILWAIMYNVTAFLATSGLGGVYVPAYRASLMMTTSSFVSLSFPLMVAAFLQRRMPHHDAAKSDVPAS